MENYRTLDDLIEDYEIVYSNTYKSSTIETHKNAYKLYVKPFFGDTPISEIDTVMVFDWWNKITSMNSSKNIPYAEKTINCHIKSALSILFSLAVKFGYISRNPMVVIPKYKNPNKVPKNNDNYLEYNEFAKLICCIDEKIYYNIFYLLYFTGMRIGELLALTWADVDFINKKININKTIRYISKELGYLTTSPKTKNSIRTIELSNGCMDLLCDIYNEVKNEKNFNKNYYVFGKSDFLKYDTIRKHLYYYLDKANVRRVTLHGLRHSHASCLINMGVQDYLIANRLGHNVEELHHTYAHIFNSKRQELESVLDNMEGLVFEKNEQIKRYEKRMQL